MGLRCSNCGYDNDPTRVYCHSCGGRLERGAATSPPTGFTHPTDVAKMKKPRQALEWRKYASALVRLLILAGIAAAVVLALLPPRNLPPPVEADEGLARRLSSLLASSAGAGGTRAFSIPAGDVGKWLASSVALKGQDGGLVRIKPERVYAAPGEGVMRVGVETSTSFGLHLYFEGLYEPVAEGEGSGLAVRRLSVGRLPLPWLAGLFAERQLVGLGDALAVPLGQLARASHIGITPETVTLRWSADSR